ncbi:MAG TPA: DUF192 domain-containing protein [Nitrososphaera sp.]|nr:DUF192 domain-containing protein [Nitrososphaera sp.]
MRSITIVAIVAAAAAGIIAAAALFYSSDSAGYGSIDTLESAPSGQEAEQESVTDDVTPSNSSYRQVNVSVNGVKLVADIADTNDKRTKGLSVKDSLNETEAMLFVFSTEREHSFWMKGMKFPIDIIWIDEDKEVVHVEHSLEPCIPDEFCQPYRPDDDSLYVLETVAGFAQKYNVTENTYVDFQLEK